VAAVIRREERIKDKRCLNIIFGEMEEGEGTREYALHPTK